MTPIDTDKIRACERGEYTILVAHLCDALDEARLEAKNLRFERDHAHRQVAERDEVIAQWGAGEAKPAIRRSHGHDASRFTPFPDTRPGCGDLPRMSAVDAKEIQEIRMYLARHGEVENTARNTINRLLDAIEELMGVRISGSGWYPLSAKDGALARAKRASEGCMMCASPASGWCDDHDPALRAAMQMPDGAA